MLWCVLLHFVFYPSAWKGIVKFTGNLLNTTALELGHVECFKPHHWFIYKEGSLTSLTYWQLHCIYWQSLLGIWLPWYNSCITCSYIPAPLCTQVHDIQGFSPICIHWIIIMTVTLLLSDCCNCSYFFRPGHRLTVAVKDHLVTPKDPTVSRLNGTLGIFFPYFLCIQLTRSRYLAWDKTNSAIACVFLFHRFHRPHQQVVSVSVLPPVWQ